MSEQFFTVEATAKFFQVPEATICEWLKRCELLATLHNRQLMIGAGEIAETIRRFPERAPMGLPGIQRQRLRRIVTSANRGLIPAREV